MGDYSRAEGVTKGDIRSLDDFSFPSLTNMQLLQGPCQDAVLLIGGA